MAVALNGRITNAEDLREELGLRGVVFQSDSDSEVIGCLVARHYSYGMAGAIERTVNELEGAFSFVVLYEDSIYAVRDQWGFRPLVLGWNEYGYGVASESCALDVLGMTDRRDVRPGEIVEVTRSRLRTVRPERTSPRRYAPSTSTSPGPIRSSRCHRRLGPQAPALLLPGVPVEADVWCWCRPGISAAMGYPPPAAFRTSADCAQQTGRVHQACPGPARARRAPAERRGTLLAGARRPGGRLHRQGHRPPAQGLMRRAGASEVHVA